MHAEALRLIFKVFEAVNKHRNARLPSILFSKLSSLKNAAKDGCFAEVTHGADPFDFSTGPQASYPFPIRQGGANTATPSRSGVSGNALIHPFYPAGAALTQHSAFLLQVASSAGPRSVCSFLCITIS